MRLRRLAALAALVSLAALLPAQTSPRTQVGGVFPDATVMAPAVGSRSEAGIGALVPWADRLWAVGYVAHVKGEGLGLYELGADLKLNRRAESVTGTFANRMVHWESEQVFLGPHAIDAQGKVRTIEALKGHRLAATARHLKEPAAKVYFLTMEGLLFEVDTKTLAATQLFDLARTLDIDGGQPHFKAAHTAQGRLVVANNTYDEAEHLDARASGRLAEWDGESWRLVERNAFVEVSGKQNPAAGETFGNTLYALGWDRASVILRVLHKGVWTRYLLPRGSHSYDHTWNTEWMRIREVQTERYLMDAFGMFYELPALTYGGRVWGIKPISSHLRLVPDFCSYRGLFVMASAQTDNAVGQPQSGFWFGDLDALWAMGKPQGWGGPWWKTLVRANEPSDPFLMTGFDQKVLHITQESAGTVGFKVQVDFLGDGSWFDYDMIPIAAGGYVHHVFQPGFAAHWIRLIPSAECVATAQFFYR